MSKGIIVQRFKQNVKGKKFNPNGYNQLHDGKEGHWLEKQMGIEPNSDNNADIYGYEMKKQTPSKTTFGDWSAKESIFKRGGVDGHTLSR
ncbi:MAG: LlaMI family restriction endonuclease, partial [Psychromonas sp.]|nr:LlaMI family restriction endonuclease [Psychromonas sp.]